MNKKYKVPFNYLNYEFSNNKKIFSEWKKLIASTYELTICHIGTNKEQTDN